MTTSNSSQLVTESSHTRIYISIFAVLIGFSVFRRIFQAAFSPLRKLPGPFLARFTRLWEVQANLKHEATTFNISLHERYGPIVRLAPNRYSVSDPDAAKAILGHQNGLDKSPFYLPFGSAVESNMFSEPSTAVHSKLRRPVAQLYSTTTLLAYEPFVDACNTALLKILDEYAQNGKILDVRELVQYYAFDVVGEITVGSRFGLMEENGDKSGVIEAVDESVHYGALVGLLPEWHWLLEKTANLLMDMHMKRIIRFVNMHLDDRISGKTKCPDDRKDFLARLLPLEEEGKSTRFHTRLACLGNITAGSDTTAISISATIAYLAMNPDKLTTLRHELDQAYESRDSSNPFAFQKAQKLPYLQAVIREALRIHPPVAIHQARIVGEAGIHVAGQYFPPRTELGVNPWVVHRNKAIFGADANEFRPERWLTDDDEERTRLERNFLTFGYGPRTCIGKNITMLEMSTLVPRLVRSYDFELVADETTGKMYSWNTQTFAKPSFKCLVKKRL